MHPGTGPQKCGTRKNETKVDQSPVSASADISTYKVEPSMAVCGLRMADVCLEIIVSNSVCIMESEFNSLQICDRGSALKITFTIITG